MGSVATDSDYGVPRKLSALQNERALYHPELPPCLQGTTVSRWAQLLRVPSVWRRKKPPVHAATAKPGSRSQNRALMRQAHRERVWTAKATSVLCFVAVLAVAAASIAVFRLTTGYHCTSWICYLTEKFVEFLELPPLYEWLPMLSLKWLLNK